MKTQLLFLMVMFLSLQAMGQNYRLLNETRTAHFSGINDEIFSIRIDEVNTTLGDSLYRNHETFFLLNPPSPSCFAIVGDSSWLGNKVVLDTTAIEQNYTLYTREHANGVRLSIDIKTWAGLNESWLFSGTLDGNTDFIEATVVSVGTETILGVVDSVKTILLQAKNSLGANIPNDFNGREIKISQNHGLVQIFNIFQFPLDTIAYHLIGLENPDHGIQNLEAKDIYNFNVGDEFHTLTGIQPDPWTLTIINDQKRILSKLTSVNQDTISYTYQSCKLTIDFIAQDTVSSIDTLTDVYVLSNLTSFDKLNHELIEDSTGQMTFNMNNDFSLPIREKSFISLYAYDTGNNCWGGLVGNPYLYSFYEGLGGGYYYDNDIPFVVNQHTLVYYHKGTEVWGNPFSFGCTTNLSTVKFEANKTAVKIYPNPSSSRFNIDLGEMYENVEIRVLNVLGATVYSSSFASAQTFDLELEEKGMYILTVTTSEGSASFPIIKN